LHPHPFHNPQKQKEMLDKVKEANELTKKLKEEEKRKLIEEELMYNRLFEEVQEKQERARAEQLEKMKLWQVRRKKKKKSALVAYYNLASDVFFLVYSTVLRAVLSSCVPHSTP
jgi:lipopolysaccharide export LptBFGC system permease protein LptF